MIGKFVTRKEHPSYYAFILDGMTTLGEYWEKNPRSHCHDMMGHIIEWYYNGIAGIQPLKPGFKEVRICPYLPEGMTEFTCTYDSASGKICVAVKEVDNTVFLNVSSDEKIHVEISTDLLQRAGKNVKIV